MNQTIKATFKSIVSKLCLETISNIKETLSAITSDYELDTHTKTYYTYYVPKDNGGSFPSVYTINLGYRYELLLPAFELLEDDEIHFLNQNDLFESHMLTNLYYTKLCKIIILLII